MYGIISLHRAYKSSNCLKIAIFRKLIIANVWKILWWKCMLTFIFFKGNFNDGNYYLLLRYDPGPTPIMLCSPLHPPPLLFLPPLSPPPHTHTLLDNAVRVNKMFCSGLFWYSSIHYTKKTYIIMMWINSYYILT